MYQYDMMLIVYLAVTMLLHCLSDIVKTNATAGATVFVIGRRQ